MCDVRSIMAETCFLVVHSLMSEPFFYVLPVRGGGSILITALFESILGIKTVFLGFGLDSDNLHSPNEKFNIDNFYKGIETIPYFHQYYAEMKG
jgi:hypothetical protein